MGLLAPSTNTVGACTSRSFSPKPPARYPATEPGGNRSIRCWPISATITRSTGTGGLDGHLRLTPPVGSGVTWSGATSRRVLENSLAVRLGVDGDCAAGHSGRDPHLRQARRRPGDPGRTRGGWAREQERHAHHGLRARQKLAGQIVVGAAFGIMALHFPNMYDLTPLRTAYLS